MFIGDDRLPATIATSGYNGKTEIPQKQVMKRSGWQHHSEPWTAGCDGVRNSDWAVCGTIKKCDRRRRRLKHLLLSCRHLS